MKHKQLYYILSISILLFFSLLFLLFPFNTKVHGNENGNKSENSPICKLQDVVNLSSSDRPKNLMPIEFGNKIRIVDSILVDSVPADFPARFNVLTSGDWQFVGYYNKDRFMTIASRKIQDTFWRYKILPVKVNWDSHKSITMAPDRDKCIHLTGNMHNDSLFYFKTEKPLDISTFRRVFPQVSAEDELSCTYPHFMRGPHNELIFTYRKGGSGNGYSITNVYNETTKSFSRLTNQPLFDGIGEMSAYASGPGPGPDRNYHVIWFWRDTPECETNHDLSYARSSDLVHWETIDGTKVKLPITPRTKQCTVDPVPALGGAINGGAILFFDSDKKPMIAYMKYDKSGISQIFIAKAQKNQWVINQISRWNYRWNFSGPGSIESEIKLQKVHVLKNGAIAVSYWHIKKGYGELIFSPENLCLIEDRLKTKSEGSEFPEALMTPSSKLEGMSVRWMKIQTSNKNSNEYYGLRWETMGKRRFYKPREKPVPASSMKLYKFIKE